MDFNIDQHLFDPRDDFPLVVCVVVTNVFTPSVVHPKHLIGYCADEFDKGVELFFGHPPHSPIHSLTTHAAAAAKHKMAKMCAQVSKSGSWLSVMLASPSDEDN